MKTLLLASMFMMFTVYKASSWAQVDPRILCGVVPGDGYCSCFWAQEGDPPKRVPGSDYCAIWLEGAGGCTRSSDCHNTLNSIGSGPIYFPQFNLGNTVDIIYWGG